MQPKVVAFVALALAAPGFAGCMTDGSRACTLEARASLTVTVMGPDGRICDADVMADQGTERTTLMGFPGPECTYAGPYEKPGTFVVSASKSGFRSATAMVTVGSGECHVVGEKVTLTLSPE